MRYDGARRRNDEDAQFAGHRAKAKIIMAAHGRLARQCIFCLTTASATLCNPPRHRPTTMKLSITSDYCNSNGLGRDYLRLIAEAGFTHVHWCQNFADDYLYSRS